MNEPLALLGTPHIGFIALIIIGGLAGWIGGHLVGTPHGLFTNILVGICGSWLGSRLAELGGFAVYGSIRHFVAALVGSVILLWIWQMLRPARPTPRM